MTRSAEKSVAVVEVGGRDGLQNEPEVFATQTKVELLTRMMIAGARRLEVASFVHPKLVPQMADAEAVVAALPDRRDVSYIVLVLNKRGLLRALATREGNRRGVDEAGCVAVASDSFGQRNQGQSIEDAIRENREMLRLARQEGLVPQVTVSVAFGCPFEGDVPQPRVLDIIQRLAECEPDQIALADTIGAAVPSQVSDLFGRARELLPESIALRAHFHNTRNTGIANAWAAYEAGAAVLDSSVGGLGGCPFAPRATGNIATEDLLYLLHRSGVVTGVNLDATIETARWFESVRGKPAASMLAKAGPFPACA